MSKPLIFGTGASSFKDEAGLLSVCEKAIEQGIIYFDTAPSYKTEEVLALCLFKIAKSKNLNREHIKIQTKIDPIQMYRGNVETYFRDQLRKMGLDYIDALLIHWPVHKYIIDTWNALNRLKSDGVVKKIGICNLRVPHLKELRDNGIVPEILQIERHPLNSFSIERDYCKRHDIELQDYSPLCKMHPLLKESPILNQLSVKYNRSIGNIILRWHIDTGATPIFTSKNLSRIEDYATVDSFELSAEDVTLINTMNINHKLYLESLVCPGF